MTTTQSISLSRLHAINWYGYADSIPVVGNLLLAGVTGSGKSILMDLLQFVLVGDRRLVKFNQSATGEASTRDLKSYVLGDVKEDEEGVTQYMRDTAVTYAALEFTWPRDPRESAERVETWGLWVEYENAADMQGRISPWWCQGRLGRADFLAGLPEGGRVPRELPDWRAFIEARGGEVFASVEEYRRDMASSDHLNFDRNILSRLLPKAMSFTFLRSFNDFCRAFILPAERLDVRDVTASYRTFQSYERDLAELRRQLEALVEMRALHRAYDEATRDAALSRYLAAEVGWQHAEAVRAGIEKQLSELRAAATRETARIATLENLVAERREEVRRLEQIIGETEEGRLYQRIKSENRTLAAHIERLHEVGTSLESALAARVSAAQAWVHNARNLPLELEATPMVAVEQAAERARTGGVTRAEDTLPSLNEAARRALAEVNRVARSSLERLTALRQKIGALREEVAALRLGRLPFPTRVLEMLNQALPASGKEPSAQHLCSLCEVTDERWRPAIEVAFTRKFAVVVAPGHYDDAERIYHAWLGENTGESLVNPAKALKLARPVKPGSLAEKIETHHPVAKALVSRLFGELICCEQREELRGHDAAILPDGFQARGAFVERARHYDGMPFVGQRGLELQRIWKERQLGEHEREKGRLEPLERMVAEVQDEWRNHFENPATLHKELAQVAALPDLKKTFAANREELNLIDREKFDAVEQRRATLDGELATWVAEHRGLLGEQKHQEVQRVERQLTEAARTATEAKDAFAKVRYEPDVSGWLTQLNKLRDEVITRFPALDVAARRFQERHTDRRREADVSQAHLLGKRQVFSTLFPKFNDLPVNAPDNDAYERVLIKIEDAEIPDYETKSKEESRRWEHLFREQVLEKLRARLTEVKNIISMLNTSLNKPIGTSRYSIEHGKNPEFAVYHDMLDATAAAGTEFFASIADPLLREQTTRFLKLLVEAPDGVEAARLLDCRHYYRYDMHVEDLSLPPGERQKISVDRQSGKFSGGEHQSPYFIAILASYLRAYRRHDRYKIAPSLALVPIDEAFSKLSGERIADCIDALRQLDLQGVFSMSTGNVPYAFEKCDQLLAISKHERREGRKLKVRNVAMSLARDSDEWREFMRDFA